MWPLISHVNSFPSSSSYNIINNMTKPINPKNEHIRRNRISMSYSPLRFKPLQIFSFPHDEHSSRFHIMHNVPNLIAIETNIAQCVSYKIPIQLTVSFFKVNLEDHKPRLSIVVPKGVDHILLYDNIISILAF